MRTIVTDQQIKHFFQFGWIEFEGFLTPEQCDALLESIKGVVAKRLKTTPDKLTRFANPNLYSASRDLWRDDPALKQILSSERFASPAASLSNKQQLHLAFDQWILPPHNYSPLQLEAHFSFQNLACGCLVALEGEQKGHARFVRPERFPLFTVPQLLVAYGNSSSVFVHNAADPSNGSLRQLGYSFGDRLNSQLHPLCKLN